MAVGELKCVVLDVTDLEAAAAFWSEVTGLAPIPSPFPGRYGYLGTPDPWDHRMILHLVRTAKTGDEANRCHLDVWVEDVDRAIGEIEALGGTLRKAPAIYPRPGSYPGERPVLDWAVLRDPFENEFCVISLLTRDQRHAVVARGASGPGDDHDWRVAAGRAHG